jgi:hypothetical protein
MPNFELTLEGFTFPKDLPEARSTFRFLIDIRYIDPDGKFATAHAVLPGLDTYWECEKEKAGEASYVRHKTLPKFDMDKIDEWDRLIALLKAKSLHSLQIKVFDIEKTGGFLDKIKEYAGMIVEALVGKATSAATGGIPAPPDFAKDAFGAAVHDVEAFALAQLAGIKQQNSLIFKRSEKNFPAAPGGVFSIKGAGTKGDYEVELKVTEK